ncbi:TonB-dependent receptor [Temperatibacter marinus]|uniref:TonB-dependent receptor n=1 Tax=Temperatibacter marinus TaxID=1456591 RepID=A0AA52HAR1_9PROT|nr:TonB-dependent receptor [Temperatibacter marinus]WND03862.1 TonB-dependent receptor [Temperatibacter marinus]
MLSTKNKFAHGQAFKGRSLKTILMAGVAMPVLSLSALAQDDDKEQVEEIEVTGTRATIRSSIDVKRNSTSIVEALSSKDIGDIPALSIGEALETLTSAASHREQGGATEISIRGLGPYLGSTIINGREAANGSGDRSVNFSQFPSELFSKLAIYKSMEARLIEGGVSGQIQLDTLKPLEYGKRRIQADYKLNYNPDNFNIDEDLRSRDFGHRLTLSYVDQFELNGLGDVGISLGFQKNTSTNPEQEARTSSGFRDCRNVVSGDPDSDNFGVDSLGDRDQNCDSGGGDLVLEVDPETGVAPDAGTPFLFTSSQRHFRQNITDDDRKSVFAALQWRPDDRWDINVDFQYSDRNFSERRHDLTIDGNSILNVGETGEVVPLNVTSLGAPIGFTTYDGAEISAQYAERLEEYIGGGLSIAYQVNDQLNVSLDYSYTKTERRENIIQTRLRSNTDSDTGSEDVYTGVIVENDVHRFIFRDFDVTDPNSFIVGPRTREDLNQFRNNSIEGLRADFEYELGDTFITSVYGGVRFSELKYDALPRVRRETDGNPLAVGDSYAASAACIYNGFPESGFLSSVSDGPIITNVDADGNEIASGTGNGYVAFDPMCLATAILGRDPSIPDADDVFLDRDVMGTGNNPLQITDVEEKSMAAYLQANFQTNFGDIPARGNFGVRVVQTEVNSSGYRGSIVLDRDDDNIITGLGVDNSALVSITDTHKYTRFLPSANLVLDLRDDVLMRFGVFQAMSRPDPSDLGVGRSFSSSIDNDNGSTEVADVVAQVSGYGNPQLDPLMSLNFDIALEWYPNEDTILAGGIYHKRFNGGFKNVGQLETFNIDGQDLTAIVTTQALDDEKSEITGFEVTAAHSFSYLPGALSGLGVKLSYNYADSNFEFEDANFGAADIIRSDGSVVQRVGITAPANVPGLSKHVFAGQLYYNIGDFDFQAVYKYRSEYFQQYINTPGNLRYVAGTGVVEARASYNIRDNVRLSVEAVNLFDKPKIQSNPIPENFSEVNVYGPRIYVGLRAKF